MKVSSAFVTAYAPLPLAAPFTADISTSVKSTPSMSGVSAGGPASDSSYAFAAEVFIH